MTQNIIAEDESKINLNPIEISNPKKLQKKKAEFQGKKKQNLNMIEKQSIKEVEDNC